MGVYQLERFILPDLELPMNQLSVSIICYAVLTAITVILVTPCRGVSC